MSVTHAHETRAAGADASQTQAAYQRARRLIPGGTQLLSKRPELYAPQRWPAYYREARGCEVVDLDGRRYVDMTTSGIGACLLGYADQDVSTAVIGRIERGSMCTLNCPEEVELAERLIALHPWAEQARFARTGGEALAIAVRLARAATGREKIAFCGYHGWSDWYLAANLPQAGEAGAEDALGEHLLPGLSPRGVPTGLAGTALPFRYNQLEDLEAIVRAHGDRLAAVVMEPTRSAEPAAGFLEGVRALCDRCGAKLVFDEVSAGWRFALGGAHLNYGVWPDAAVFAKALGNGHPIAAIIGRRATMEAAQTSFVSSTYWTESVGFAAALATLDKLQASNVPQHVRQIGELLAAGWEWLGRQHGVPLSAAGHPALLSLRIAHADAAALFTLLTTRMLEQGYLMASSFYPSLAHEARHVNECLTALEPVVAELADAIARGDVAERLPGPVRQSGFGRLT